MSTQAWSRWDLSLKNYVYLLSDGIHFNVCGDNDKSCIFVIIGATDKGKKELVAIYDGYRESASCWYEILQELRYRNLKTAPKLVIGDGALATYPHNASNRIDVFRSFTHKKNSKLRESWEHIFDGV